MVHLLLLRFAMANEVVAEEISVISCEHRMCFDLSVAALMVLVQLLLPIDAPPVM